ncbi:MAG TPA: hypothetical protein VHC95_07055 [Opitutales bacterium]|nr:hypothetical protein [Opitutales bacterium]
MSEDATGSKNRRCRVCGCTEDDCRQCIAKTGQPCHWVEPDLCSACVQDPEGDAEEAAEEHGEPIMLDFKPKPRQPMPANAPAGAGEETPDVICDGTGRPDLLLTLQHLIDTMAESAGALELHARDLKARRGGPDEFAAYIATETTAGCTRTFAEVLAETVNAWRAAALAWQRTPR